MSKALGEMQEPITILFWLNSKLNLSIPAPRCTYMQLNSLITHQQYIHGNNTVQEPEGVIIKLLGRASFLVVECGGFVHRGQQSERSWVD